MATNHIQLRFSFRLESDANKKNVGEWLYSLHGGVVRERFINICKHPLVATQSRKQNKEIELEVNAEVYRQFKKYRKEELIISRKLEMFIKTLLKKWWEGAESG